MENYAKSNCGHPHSKPRKASSRTTSSRRSAASRCPRCSVITPRASRWTPMPTSPPTPNSKPPRRWEISSPVPSDGFRCRSRWGQRLGQKKAVSKISNLCKQKGPKPYGFGPFWHAVRDSNPPAFWSVGCLKHKSETFRLRFVLFTAVHSADFPLFPSRPACSGSVLGQKWVRENFEITKQKLSSVCPI